MLDLTDLLHHPDDELLDTDGRLVQAHGGHVVPDTTADGSPQWWWYGEDRSHGTTRSPGVRVYRSDDLRRWDDHGLALTAVDHPDRLLDDPALAAVYGRSDAETRARLAEDLCTDPRDGSPAAVIERPAVARNPVTGQWVMWFHADGPTPESDSAYAKARAAVAVADRAEGPFRLLGSRRLHHAPPGERDWYPEQPGMARDLTLFTEGAQAWLVYASEENHSLYVAALDDGWTGLAAEPGEAVPGRDHARVLPGEHRESPVVFRRGEVYHLLTSGCTGWHPNPAAHHTAPHPLGPWTPRASPVPGEGEATTHGSQPTTVVELDGDRWLYVGDRWRPEDLARSGYLWAELDVADDGVRIAEPPPRRGAGLASSEGD